MDWTPDLNTWETTDFLVDEDNNPTVDQPDLFNTIYQPSIGWEPMARNLIPQQVSMAPGILPAAASAHRSNDQRTNRHGTANGVPLETTFDHQYSMGGPGVPMPGFPRTETMGLSPYELDMAPSHQTLASEEKSQQHPAPRKSNKSTVTEKPLRCGWIGCTHRGTFGRKPELMRHIELIHVSPGSEQCSICGKFFNRKDNLGEHVRRMHTDRL
ncbi:hypothetical protein FE257_001075 [Aspergillus nanangensis]|uniref:C2H2-type domain-containing protein n=1 Tax=Aspergillus nanangensis TaxID=2582783 RepID=A0AAD4CUH7_ASPNN|nr:hypothetical protein FE257_001075 [Aspergillus nanangensis]